MNSILNSHELAACSSADYWVEAEARFRQAKQALLDAQQQHCAAAHEFLLARAQVRHLLEAVFPEPPAPACSEPASSEACRDPA